MPTVLRAEGVRLYFWSREPNEPPHELRPLPEACPFVLDDLLTAQPDVLKLVAKLGKPE